MDGANFPSKTDGVAIERRFEGSRWEREQVASAYEQVLPVGPGANSAATWTACPRTSAARRITTTDSGGRFADLGRESGAESGSEGDRLGRATGT